MKGISALLFCLLFCSTLPSQAQSDSARYKVYVGTYVMSTPSFPVNEVHIFWQDSVLAFKAGGARGVLLPVKDGEFSFSTDDHAGTVAFKKTEQGHVSDIVIVMDGERYLGSKKSAIAPKMKGSSNILQQ